MSKINFEDIEAIDVDCVIGLGWGCRIAASLKRNRKHNLSNPFNWLGKYNLNDVINLLSTCGANFFIDYRFSPKDNRNDKLAIIDNNNGFIAAHDFQKKVPIKINEFLFRYKYKRKFKLIKEYLQNSNNICIITQRKINTDDILSFIEKFSNIFSYRHLYYINVYDTKEKEQLIKVEKNNVTIIQCYFNDEHENGRDEKTNIYAWLGNVEYWDNIVDRISINKKLLDKYNKKHENLIVRTLKYINKILNS